MMLSVLAGGALSVAGCNAPPNPQQTLPPASQNTTIGVTSPVSINAEMVRVVDHAAHQLWNAEKEGMAPKTDADWENLAEHATQVAAAGVVIRLEGTGPNDRDWVQQADWQKWAAAVSSAGMAAFQAVETRNTQALVMANGQLVEACESCHKKFKPQLPSEGIAHSHGH
ncbi:MAG: hypothetical protein ABI868_16005 [Acidobacteriota bacterium]